MLYSMQASLLQLNKTAAQHIITSGAAEEGMLSDHWTTQENWASDKSSGNNFNL